VFGIWLEKSSQLELADADLKTIVHTSFELANTKSPLLGSPSLLVLVMDMMDNVTCKVPKSRPVAIMIWEY